MADHSLPVLTSTYANTLSELDGRLDDISLGFNTAYVAATNPPTNTIRWNSTSALWQINTGTPAVPVWGSLATSYTININGTVGATTPTTGAFTTLSTSGIASLGANSTVGGSNVVTLSATQILSNKTLDSTNAYNGAVIAVSYGGTGASTTAAAPFALKGTNSDITSLTGLSGNVSFTGTANRFTGDFSNATLASRALLQTSTANSSSSIGVIPNGTSTTSSFIAYNASTPTNTSWIALLVSTAEAKLTSGQSGSGAYLPLTIYTSNLERVRVDTSGNVGIGNTAAATALLDVQSTTKGIRFPRMTSAQKSAITNTEGLVIYDSTAKTLALNTGTAWDPVGGATLSANNFTGGQNFARATVASAASADIWSVAGNQIDWTGEITATGFAAAPQAGAERVLICAGAPSFTAGANMLIDGVASGSNLTCVAGDQVIVRAVSTTQFKLSRIKYDGTAQVGATIASTAEAQAGTANAKFITPLRLREGFNAAGSAPVYACRAWVNFNGKGTVAIRASGNVSSITDNGVGNFNINFTTAMQDINYSVVGAVSYRNSDGSADLGEYMILHGDGAGANYLAPTTTSVRVGPSNDSSGATDPQYINVIIFR